MTDPLHCVFGGCLLRVVIGDDGTNHYERILDVGVHVDVAIRKAQARADERATRESEVKVATVRAWRARTQANGAELGAFVEGYNAALADKAKLDAEEAAGAR